MRKLFWDGFKKELNEDDIYEVRPSYQSQKLGNKLEKHWDKQKSTITASSFVEMFRKIVSNYCNFSINTNYDHVFT
jgi:hypothetical protein